MSVTQVWERLFIGGFGDAEALAGSNPHGIRTLITLSPEAWPEEDFPAIHHRYLPMLGNRPLPVRWVGEFLAVMFVNIQWGKVLIHSCTGTNRSPILAAAWMHIVGYKNIDGALVDIGRLRPIDPNPVLLSSVKENL